MSARFPLSVRAVVSSRRAFTLIELLVVIGIIALLAAILFPSIGSARFQSRVTVCTANLRQLAMASLTYANQNDGQLVNLDMPSTGANLWDVPHSFYSKLRKEGVSHDAFFCPAATDEAMARARFTQYPTFHIINYNVWILRKNGNDPLPPPLTWTGGKYTLVNPLPTEGFQGPSKMSDVNIKNPIFSDLVVSDLNAPTPPANADPSLEDNAYMIAPESNHRHGGRLRSLNLAYADGRVESKAGNEVRPLFKGNRWNWR
jgi:prepilin-type N-terminal cleavage/methylation domain-containing protein/prepilin-type processing-associated H-X9-DG protein